MAARGEASVLSGTSKSVNNSTYAGLDESKAEQGSVKTIDLFEKYVFPIVAEANRGRHVKAGFRLLEFFYIFFQIYFAGYNDFVPYDDANHYYVTILKVIYFGFIGNVDGTVSFIIALLIIDIVTFAFLIATVIDYQINYEYRKWMLTVLRVWHGHLFGIFLIPNVLMISDGLAYLGINPTISGYVIVILTIVCGFISLWSYTTILPFFSRSPFITPSPVQSWNVKAVYTMIIIHSIPMGIEAFLNDDFVKWIEIVPLAIMFATSFLLISRIFYLPFKGTIFNALGFGALCANVAGSFLSVFDSIQPKIIPDVTFYTVPVAVFVVATIVGYIVLYRIRKNIEKKLMYQSFNEPGVKPTEEAKLEHIESFNIKNHAKAVMYAHIGFEGMCDMFVDWSLFKYYSETFPLDSDLLALMTWFVALFPSEIQFLHKLITSKSKINDISLVNDCLFFQIHRIHIFRQSSASREASNDFAKVKAITEKTIAAYCKFWNDLSNPNMEFKDDIYVRLSSMKQQAEAAWSEALDKYPNNSRFVNEYARYLLEVSCEFKNAIIQHQHALELDNGVKLQNDRTFRHFVYTFPNYLKKGVVDIRGTLKGPRMNKIDQSASATTQSHTSKTGSSNISSASGLSSNDDSSDEQIDENEGARFLPQMNLRLALQRSVNDLSSSNIKKIKFASAIRVILTIAYVVIAAVILSPLFGSRKNLFEMYVAMNKIQQYLELMSIQMPWFIYEGVHGGKLDYTKLIEESQEALHYFESEVDLSKSIKANIADLAVKTLESMNDLGFLIYHVDIESTKSLAMFGNLYLKEKTDVYICTLENGYISPSIAEKTIPVDYQIRSFATLTRILTKDTPDIISKWAKNSLDFCDHFHSQIVVADLLKSLMATISSSLNEVYEDILSNDNETSVTLAKNPQLKLIQKLRKKNSKISENLIKRAEEIKSIKEQQHKYYKYFEMLSKTDKNTFNLENYEFNNNIINGIIRNNVATNADSGGGEDKEEEEESDRIKVVCNFLISISPFIILLFILPSVVFMSAGIKSEFLQYSRVLKGIPPQDCANAGERIQKIVVDKTTSSNSKGKVIATVDMSSTANIPAWLFSLFSAVVIIGLFLLISIYTKSIRDQIDDISEYFVLFMVQRNLLFDIGREALFTYMFDELSEDKSSGFGQNFTDPKESAVRCISAMIELIIVNDLINVGTDKLSATIGVDAQIDNIRFDAICPDDVASDKMIEYYKCISLERTISFFVQVVNSYLSSIIDIDTITNSTQSNNDHRTVQKMHESAMTYVTHMLDTRIGTGFNHIADRLDQIFKTKLRTFNIMLVVVVIISILFVIAVYFIENIIIGSFERQIETFKCLILRINPITFVANANLIALVYGKTSSTDSNIVSAAHAVFITSHDAMISLNQEGVIESINPSATTIFGYTPEQMLGQHLKMLFNPELKENSTMFYTMQLMQSGQASLIYEAEVNGTRDDERQVPLKVTLLGFSSDDRIADNFALMCKDQTQEIKQKTAVNEAKKQSEQLLLQILPKDIIMRLNRGDQDISFTVPSSTICFIDIEKFSNYSASLSASEIMQNLGLVFTAYDKLLYKYDLLIKIKLIGDDYMCAAGLFNLDVEPCQHAIQVVSFALECLDAIEELNEQLNASLQVRIGINSGGPLIAGVLGTDKPLFDIIGDPINVAARLQSTDIPGLAQISQACYDLVAKESFRIEQRGEVELKGKGKQMTYLVHPRDSRRDESQLSLELPSSIEQFAVE
ncbi:Adenylate and Guanylate cyclase catalytic domain containing protein [Tritrichomonas foetus]|uniref:Adenylate and Guanylate cyclase catalytic domain containing protein n=1 Tax=Tritrichomonas foetus TaxID=1144522 RepID=A0A1J4JNT7_9EUKA|nr:Adenylate and Guanylate cyclase catalytic domain containing protein [Tritrichomonas foetus]|eukprot:OHT00793.1 Adenylate and Guanylate cyclase catalytic domain containing protein [Tritrichomonas foetus]